MRDVVQISENVVSVTSGNSAKPQQSLIFPVNRSITFGDGDRIIYSEFF